MDDLCLCIYDISPAAVMQKTSMATSLLQDLLDEHAMIPNMKPGKTELLLSLRGPGVRAVRTRLFGPSSPGTIPIVGEN